MVFALAADRLFDIEKEGEFEDTIIGTFRIQCSVVVGVGF